MKKPKLDITSETFDHMITVLMILFGDKRDIDNEDTKTDKEWEDKHKRSKAQCKEVKEYLESFVVELIKSF